MWFSMPEGCGGITVELQAFVPEVKDDKGQAFFRAPDHFAPRILMLAGFAAAEPPPGSPADLPKADPLRDGAISQLTQSLAAKDIEIQGLREDLGVANAKATALENERNVLQVKLVEAEAKADGLQEQLDDMPAKSPITGTKAK